MKTKEQMRKEYWNRIPGGVLDYLIDYAHGDCYPGDSYGSKSAVTSWIQASVDRRQNASP